MIAVAEGLKAVIAALDQSGIPYMIVGSVAAAIYGEPRLTRDVDVVINVATHTARVITESFTTVAYYVPPLQVIAQEFAHQGQFNLLHMPSGLKIDVVIQKSTPHGMAEFARRRQLEILPNLVTWVASPEDVIITKLKYFREGGSEKHLRDIRGIKAQMTLDQAYLELWTQRLHLMDEWNQV